MTIDVDRCDSRVIDEPAKITAGPQGMEEWFRHTPIEGDDRRHAGVHRMDIRPWTADSRPLLPTVNSPLRTSRLSRSSSRRCSTSRIASVGFMPENLAGAVLLAELIQEWRTAAELP